ncbi:hypothetical protein GCM10010319_00250 [Streptomyces blastmyceticus]|uniref:Uncharacterized protein n=1 Tax=Streptomyces blastmyceticus TaxID=68180 RepID=A0ABN0W7W3_9ACTN
MESQRGAAVTRRSGQVRSGMSTASYDPYLCTGIPEGRWVTVAAVTGVGGRTEISGICVGLLVCPLGGRRGLVTGE